MVIINHGATVVEGEVAELLNTQDLIVRLEVDDPGKVMSIITTQFGRATAQQAEGKVIQISLERTQIPILTKALIAGDVRIFSIESKKKLEDYFIKMVTADVA
jgi:ABC-type uncharacterized transport system ATPase subunit